MDSIFCINPQLHIPIYQQLVDAARSAIKRGVLDFGQQLPTVQEVSEELSIARGTVKRVYDELEREGLIEKVQGRGTFVCYRPVSTESRKEQAMTAIDELLQQLDQMGFSPAEINIFLNLKLRERAAEESLVKVSVVECNPETLSQLVGQLRHMKQVDLYSHLLEDVRQYPYKLSEDYDLVVTTATHGEYVQSILSAPQKLVRIALRPPTGVLAAIIRMQAEEKIGLFPYSQRFGQLMRRTCETYAEDTKVQTCVPLDEVTAEDLAGLDTILVPQGYERYCTAEVAEKIAHFAGHCIECSYEMDEGSLLYLQTKIQRLLEKKTV